GATGSRSVSRRKTSRCHTPPPTGRPPRIPWAGALTPKRTTRTMAATAWSREGGLVRFALGLLIPLAAALLQGTVAPLIALGDARPVLPLLVAGCWAIAAGAREAIWWAFLGGLVADLLSGGPLGAFALASLPPVAATGVQDRGVGRTTPVVAAAVRLAAAT